MLRPTPAPAPDPADASPADPLGGAGVPAGTVAGDAPAPVGATAVPGARRSRRRLARLGAQGLVLALVAAGSTAFAVLHTTVTVDVDGSEVEVSSFARTVGDVLADAGIDAGPRDLVAPALDAPVEDGGEIVVRHGRMVTVEVDGVERQIWTTALTVGEAVADLGTRGDGARVSASRSAPLGRGEVLEVSTRKTVHVALDGEVVDTVTTAPTVREVLVESGLVLGEGDQVSVPLDATVVDGLVVAVSRVVRGTDTVVEEIPFTETVVEDPTSPEGERAVQTPGRAGQREKTFQVTTVGGAEVARTVVTDVVLSEPVAQVIRVGTKKPVAPPPPAPARSAPARSAPSGGAAPAAPAAPITVDPNSAQGIARGMLAARGWGDDQFSCLVKLWTKESGWRVNAENRSSGAYGIPQALPGSKMASAGADWRTNPATQISWGLGYIAGRYGTPCGAWGAFQAKGWY